MKKICLFVMLLLLITGCSSKGNTHVTYMLEDQNELYALYNHKADKLTENIYKNYQETDFGYIVYNDKNEVGFISLKGKEVIPFGEYRSLESLENMLVGRKNEHKEKRDERYMKEDLFIMNDEGEVLYEAGEGVQIAFKELPVVYKDKMYYALNTDGDVLYETEDQIQFVSSLDNHYTMSVKGEAYIYEPDVTKAKDAYKIPFKGNLKIVSTHPDDSQILCYDKTSKQLVNINIEKKAFKEYPFVLTKVESDEAGNVLLYSGTKAYVFEPLQGPVLLTSLYKDNQNYTVRSRDIYGPHFIYGQGQKTGEVENCQLYPKPLLVRGNLFPIYVRDKGYVYYNFDGKKVIDGAASLDNGNKKMAFMSAEPFDEYGRAIVRLNGKGMALIDESGNIVSKENYYQIKYIGSSYYAVYNEVGMFGIIDGDGKEVLEMGYTTLPSQPIIEYNGKNYMMLVKNGITYVYDLEHDFDVKFSYEGKVSYHDKGYFETDQGYFTFDGDRID